MKTLKTKKVNVLACWNGLKNMPPREFQSIAEMEKTGTILDLFKEAVSELAEALLEGEKINTDIQLGKIVGEEIIEKKTEFQKMANGLEDATGKEEIEIALEDDVFNTFFQQFERWGKNWFQKVEDLLSFRKDLNLTNKQPKGK